MRILVVEDEFITRKLLLSILSIYGECDVAVDGEEAVLAFTMAHEENRPYDLICLDILMPNKDGHQALKEIREKEKIRAIKGPDEVKIMMMTTLGDPVNVFEAYNKGGATSYIVKPVDKVELIAEIHKLGLLGKVNMEEKT